MAKHVIRFRCIAINEVEREAIAEDANMPPLRGIVRKISLHEAEGKGDSFIQFVFAGAAPMYEVGREFFVTVTPVPTPRAPRR